MNIHDPERRWEPPHDPYAESTAPVVMCGNCLRRKVVTEGTAWCSSCNMCYCDSCLQHHRSLCTLNGHVIQRLSDLPKAKAPGHQCPSHHLPRDLFCRTCDASTCRLCAKVQHRDCLLHKEVGLGADLDDKVEPSTSATGGGAVSISLSAFNEAHAVPLSSPSLITVQGERRDQRESGNREQEAEDSSKSERSHSGVERQRTGRRLSWASPSGDDVSTPDLPEEPRPSDVRRPSAGILRRSSLQVDHSDLLMEPSKSHEEVFRRSLTWMSDDRDKGTTGSPTHPDKTAAQIYAEDTEERTEEQVLSEFELEQAKKPRMSLHRDSLEVLRTVRSHSVGHHREGVKHSDDPLVTAYRHDELLVARQRADLVISSTRNSSYLEVPRILRGSLNQEGIYHKIDGHHFDDDDDSGEGPAYSPTERTCSRIWQEVFRFFDPVIWEKPPRLAPCAKSHHLELTEQEWPIVIPDYPPAHCGLVPTLAVHVDAIDASWDEDSYPSVLVDIVVMEDGRFLAVADWSNSCIKVLERVKEPSWSVRGLKLSGQPVSITAVSTELLVITLPTQHRVVYVKLWPKLVQMRAVGTLRSYWGVAALDDQKVVVSYYGQPGGIDILDLHGNRLTIFPPTHHEIMARKVTPEGDECMVAEELWFLTNPRYLCVTPSGDIVLTDWRQHKVVCITLDGKVRWSWSDCQMRGPWGVCCLPEKGTAHHTGSTLPDIKLGPIEEENTPKAKPEWPPENMARETTSRGTAATEGKRGESRKKSRTKVASRVWSRGGEWTICVTDWGDNLWHISQEGVCTRGIMGRKDPDLLQLSGEDWPKAPRGLCATTNRHIYVTQGSGNKKILEFAFC